MSPIKPVLQRSTKSIGVAVSHVSQTVGHPGLVELHSVRNIRLRPPVVRRMAGDPETDLWPQQAHSGHGEPERSRESSYDPWKPCASGNHPLGPQPTGLCVQRESFPPRSCMSTMPSSNNLPLELPFCSSIPETPYNATRSVGARGNSRVNEKASASPLGGRSARFREGIWLQPESERESRDSAPPRDFFGGGDIEKICSHYRRYDQG